MDTPQVRVPGSENSTPNPPANTSDNAVEVEMGGTQDTVTESQTQEETLLAAQPDPPTSVKKNVGFKFLDFLTSPIVEIVVGQGENETVLTAHQNLLLESPFLAAFVDRFESSGPRRINLPEENVDAFGCFLQFQYTRDYSASRGETPSGSVEPDAGADESGEQLLRHARIYTLAEKLGLPALKTLAHSKIHRVNATPSGELSYAHYVYTNTSADDSEIRRPIAAFWASRSHVLRHEAEDDFKKLCIEVPEFAFDVLTLVLNRREKTRESELESTHKGSGRKRPRGAA